jgi:hypothetical protein
VINFNNAEPLLPQACNLDTAQVEQVLWFMEFYDQHKNVSRVMERIWIDETINDNTRAFALFTIGRMYEKNRAERRR